MTSSELSHTWGDWQIRFGCRVNFGNTCVMSNLHYRLKFRVGKMH